MLHADAGVKADLLGGFQRLGGGAAFARLCQKRRHLRVGFQHLGQRVIRGNCGKRRAHQGVGAGRIDLQRLEPRRSPHSLERKLQPARLPDPVRLHQAHLVRPMRQPVQCAQQLLRILADPEEPLRQLAPFDRRPRPPALAVDHLLVREHRHVHRVPVHHRRLAVDQPRRHHVDKHGLLLAVILWVAGRKAPAPIKRVAQRFQLGFHVVDVLVGPVLGVTPPFHRGVLGRHAERIESHWMQDVEAAGQFVARDDIPHRVVPRVPNMDAPRGIGEHLQHVILRPRRVALRREDPRLGPGLLPLRFYLGGIIARHLRPRAEFRAQLHGEAREGPPLPGPHHRFAGLKACCRAPATAGPGSGSHPRPPAPSPG